MKGKATVFDLDPWAEVNDLSGRNFHLVSGNSEQSEIYLHIHSNQSTDLDCDLKLDLPSEAL